MRRSLTNKERGEKLVLDVDQLTVTLSVEKDGNTRRLSANTYPDERACHAAADGILRSRLGDNKGTKWVLEGSPRKKRRKGKELVQLIEQHLTGFTLPDLFARFILEETYQRHEGWSVSHVGGYDELKVYFTRTLETLLPSPYFSRSTAGSFVRLANLGEDHQHADALFVDLGDPLCPIWSDVHDRFFPHRLGREFDTLPDLIGALHETPSRA